MSLLHTTEPLESFEFIQFSPGNADHERMLDQYMSTTDVENNKTRKKLKSHLYDKINGVLFIVVHKENRTIDAMSSCVLYVEDNIRSAKVWHRLHIKDNVPTTVLDAFFEPATYSWCYSNDIERLWVTFNESTPRTAFWAASRMGERRNILLPNKFSNKYGHNIRIGWRPYNKLIYEKETWQYVIYYAPDNQFFLKRSERPLNTEAIHVFKKEFPNATQDWNELQGDIKTSKTQT